MHKLFKFTHDKFPPSFPKIMLPKLYTNVKTMSLILFCLFSSLFLNQTQTQTHIFLAIFGILLFTIIKTYFFLSSSPSIYLVDYSCLKPPNYWRVPFSSFLEHSRIVHSLDQESVDFMSKILVSSGQSQTTYIPPALHFIPPRSTHEAAINEAQIVLFPVFENLLSKTKLSPSDIDIIIFNCSGFCPSPSISSIIINKYSLTRRRCTECASGRHSQASVISTKYFQVSHWFSANSYCVLKEERAAVKLILKNSRV